MTGLRTLLLAVAVFVAAARAASAQESFGLDGNRLDMGRPMVNPIPRTTVTVSNEHPPGKVLVNTVERRLYMMTGIVEDIRYAIRVCRVGIRVVETHQHTDIIRSSD